jgi:hypothetical protein
MSARVPWWAGLEADDGPLTSGSFENQSALSAKEPRRWVMVHGAEMKGDFVYHVSGWIPLARASLLCYDARWDSFRRQVSNHTSTTTTAPARFQLR